MNQNLRRTCENCDNCTFINDLKNPDKSDSMKELEKMISDFWDTH